MSANVPPSPAEKARPSNEKLICMVAIGIMLLFVVFVLVGNLASGNGVFNAIVATIVCGIAIALQVYFLRRLNSEWDRMETRERVLTTAAGVILPILAAVIGMFFIPLVLVLFFFGKLSPDLNRSMISGAWGRMGGVSRDRPSGAVRDQTGKQVGSIDRAGSVLDGHDHSVGDVNYDGSVRNKEDEKIAFIDNSGTIKNAYGDEIGSVENPGRFRDASGNPVD